LHVALTEVFHHQCRAIGSFRRHQQMHMIGHQDVSMDYTTILIGLLLQSIQIPPVILIGKETRTAIIAALNDMPRHTRQRQSCSPWHS